MTLTECVLRYLYFSDCSKPGTESRFAAVADTRETGFLNAITAAGVTFAVTRACTMGDLMECSCDKSTKGKSRWILHAEDTHAVTGMYYITFILGHKYVVSVILFSSP